jgi:hypothetical protein
MNAEHIHLVLNALVASGVLGLAALWGLAVSRRGRRVPGWLVALVLVFGGIAAGLLGRAANLGGQIRHTEIRSGAIPAGAPGGEIGGAAAERGAAEPRGADEKP